MCALVALSAHSGDFAFLKRLGIDPRQLTLMGDRYAIDEHTNYWSLDGRQVVALLDEVAHWQYLMDEDMAEGGRSIVGVRALPGDYTLVLLSQEFGDGSSQEMAVYDKNGHLTDHVCLDYGSGWQGFNIDKDPESEAQVTWTTQYRFEDTSHFVVERTEVSAVWDDGCMSNAKPIGQVVKGYHYALDDQGHLSLANISRTEEGEVIGQRYRFDDLRDVVMRPHSDASRFDVLESLIVRDDVAAEFQREATDEDYYSDAVYLVRQAVWAMSEEHPRQFLNWLYAHRDAEHISAVMRENANSGLQFDGVVLREVESFSSPAMKAYFKQLFQ